MPDIQSDSGLVKSFRIVSKVIGIIVALAGCLVMTGWFFDIAVLKSPHPALITMKANTAFCFILIGVSLWVLQPSQKGRAVYRIGQLCALVVGLIGLLSLSEYFFGFNLGIDQMLVSEPAGAVGTSHPGRMAPNTALNFLLIGLALLLLDVKTRRGYMPAQFIIWGEGIISLLALLGYIYGFSAFYGLPAFTKMAVHTMVIFNLIFIAVLSARPDRGFMAVVTSESLGGILARRLVPIVIIVPIILCWFLVWCEHQGFYAVGLKNLFSTTILILLFTLLILIIAKSLHQADIERRRLNEVLNRRNSELGSLNKELEAFAYSVSHDLRVPLRAIDGFSMILYEDYGPKLDDEAKRLLNTIRTNTRKMSELIDDLLSFSRVSRKEMTRSEVDIQKLVQTVIDELKPAFSGRDIIIEIKSPRTRPNDHSVGRATFPPGGEDKGEWKNVLPAAYADPSMLKQVFLNLIGNAVKFTGTRDKALIEIGYKDNSYYVKDNGVGFDMQYSNKLFGVFQRLHSQDEFEGTGIGLALVQRILHKHGGEVRADGKLNEGATFYFSLPKGTNINER